MVLRTGSLRPGHSCVGSGAVGGLLPTPSRNSRSLCWQVRIIIQSVAMWWCSWMGAMLSRGTCLSRSTKSWLSRSWDERSSDIDQSYAASRSMDGWICGILLHPRASYSLVELWWCLWTKAIARETPVQTIQMVHGKRGLWCSTEVLSSPEKCRLGRSRSTERGIRVQMADEIWPSSVKMLNIRCAWTIEVLLLVNRLVSRLATDR